MATIQQYSRAQDGSIQRSRSARLADQGELYDGYFFQRIFGEPTERKLTSLPQTAATAALYVTHPERRLSVREPAVAETQAFSRIDLSHASAGAALAHAKSRRGSLTPARTGTAGYQVFEGRVAEASPPRPSSEVYKAALSAVRESRPITSLPPVVTGYKHDISTTPDEFYDIQRDSLDRDKAIRAATGAYRMSRTRADSAPSKPPVTREAPYAASVAGSVKPETEVEAPLAKIDSSLEASRINHLARANAQLYTERPFVGLEDKDRRNSLRAATLSMSRDTYEITETSREEERPREPSAALYAAQRGHNRMQAQRTVTKTDPNALQQAISLQQAAQQRAAEKLAKLHEESYQEYYGVDSQAPRPGLSLRLRRASVDSDTTTNDAERSREIRHQMTSLRSRLNAVDERKTQDRASLMEAARRNVNATMHDMDMNIYNETGRPPPSMQKEWEEAAMERAQREVAEDREYYETPDRVNIGGEKYIQMTDVEALARSRLQPTFDEMSDRAEKQRAKELEARLDEEERERYEAIWHERELDTLAEEKRYREMQKQHLKGKGEKPWPWKRRSKRYEDTTRPVAEQEEPRTADQRATGAVAPEVEPAPQAAVATQTEAVTQAETVPHVATAPQMESVPQAETAPQVEAVSRAEAVPQAETISQAAPQVETAPQGTATATATAAPPAETVPPVFDTEQAQPTEGEERVVASGAASEEPTLARQESKLKSWFKDRVSRRSTGSGPESLKDREDEGGIPASTGFAGGAALAETDSRAAALRSHPVTGNDLVLMQQRMSVDEGNLGRSRIGSDDAARRGSSSTAEHNGEDRRPSRLRSSFMKILSGNSQENKTNGVSKANDESRTASETAEQSALSSRKASTAPTLERDELRGSASDQGLPVPPPIGKYATNGSRGSRFSEDL
ncbi:uncharacterized protein ACLA_088450 [Aspergillus clavatus NRRL 1]|uniref:Uncharacterized protein n=1 Tax=Aspergillus clavatus (strain ATCC 1007 / CBS 513.65 / DSM 816 / NCTC 3887 / NRRL 1 / QM 1276 / 107) TaxID=344612 RepID=A1CE57_ASPCL|nr:uncharacterized protein ACLA_088450 [Aspergillus clavatus NRRL 1]EAW11156.1 conserved hypothetical protein [Aspergillus clavatus NRRL 1]